MQVLRLDNEMVTLQKFNHPTEGLMRIVGDYNEDPSAPRGAPKVPCYKCQRVDGDRYFFIVSKAEAKKYIDEYLSQNN